MFSPPFLDEISPYNYEVLQLIVSKWRQMCEAAAPNEVNPDVQRILIAGFQELEKMENILNFLMTYKV